MTIRQGIQNKGVQRKGFALSVKLSAEDAHAENVEITMEQLAAYSLWSPTVLLHFT